MTFAVSGGIEWEKDTTSKVLTIRPASSPEEGHTSGQMKDYGSSGGPWGIISETGWSLVLESGIINIGIYAFFNCVGFIGDLTIPDSTISVGNNAFNNCSGFNGSLIIGNGVMSIGTYAFADCPNFSGVKFLGKQPTLNERAFQLNTESSVKTYDIYTNGWANTTTFTEYDYTKWNYKILPATAQMSFNAELFKTFDTSKPNNGEIKVWNGTEWKGGSTKIYADGEWKDGMPYVWDGTDWKPTKLPEPFEYTSESDFQIPVLNTSTTLARATQEGDWAFDETTGMNKFCMFYCTFDASGVRHEKLNPYDLTKYIATWDDTNKKWVVGSGDSHITTENTMLMIPTLYWKGEAYKITLSTDSSKGTPYAHKIGGKVYNWLAIGVYCGYNDSNVLKSLSGQSATGGVTRANFRTYAQANTVSGGSARLWNYHQYQLMRMLSYMSCKSFNGQLKIGMGGNPYTTGTTGGCNTLGPYAGDVVGVASSEKCLIEDFWGYKSQFVDDVLLGKGDYKLYVGQNATPQDDNIDDKTAIEWNRTNSTIPTTILTDDMNWGLGLTDTGGSKTVGLCDYQDKSSGSTSTYNRCFVCSHSGTVSSGVAGPGCINFNAPSSEANPNRGARISFVLD